jgi:hypothetical protein
VFYLLSRRGSPSKKPSEKGSKKRVVIERTRMYIASGGRWDFRLPAPSAPPLPGSPRPCPAPLPPALLMRPRSQTPARAGSCALARARAPAYVRSFGAICGDAAHVFSKRLAWLPEKGDSRHVVAQRSRRALRCASSKKVASKNPLLRSFLEPPLLLRRPVASKKGSEPVC